MLTKETLHHIVNSFPKETINSHVHTHLCDGRPDMTVANIAARASEKGLKLIILTPHFHKQVTDGETTLYTDSDEGIFEKLREEIAAYERSGGSVRFLLSTEADILTTDGVMALPVSKSAQACLDLVTPTVNYHPLLPLEAVAVTHIREVDDYHESGRYAELEARAGGHERILKSLYGAQTNAILNCPYPAMVGHFFISHTVPGRNYAWFGAREEDMDLMLQGTEQLLAACVKTGAMLDLTGIHFAAGVDERMQREKDGFFFRFQKYTLDRCKELDIPYAFGADAHSLTGI